MADNHHILIDRKSYFSKFKDISHDQIKFEDDEAVQFIYKLNKSEYFKMLNSGSQLNDGEFILCEPDGTRFNLRVRDLLDEYRIIYDAIII